MSSWFGLSVTSSIEESQNRCLNEAKGTFDRWHYREKTRRKVLSLFQDYFWIPQLTLCSEFT